MADVKITALTAISLNPVNPATFPIPMVDLLDTSMAASGTTKKVTVNQILGSGGTATLASATITGDLTVDTSTLKVDSTNNRVGILTATPNDILEVVGSGATGVRVSRAGLPTQYATLSAGATGPTLDASSALGALSFGLAGTTAMTLNSTGLGIGIAPESAKSTRLSVYQTGDLTDETAPLSVGNTAAGGMRLYAGVNNTNEYVYIGSVKSGTGYRSLILQPNGGNVGVGVTPSAWNSSYKAIQTQGGAVVSGTTGHLRIYQNAFQNASNQQIYVNTAAASLYSQDAGQHLWFNAASGTAGNSFSFTQAMTLDASGNLLVGTTTAGAKITALAGASGQAAIFQQPAQNFWCVLAHNQATSGDNSFALFGTEASFTSRGSITYNRAGGLVAYNVTSDYRSKDIIGPVSNSGSLIDSLKVYVGKMKGATIARPMLIAHEAQEVAPYSVTGLKDEVDADGKDKYQQIDVSSFVPLLIAEIQSLRARVQTLEAR